MCDTIKFSLVDHVVYSSLFIIRDNQFVKKALAQKKILVLKAVENEEIDKLTQ